MKAAAIGFVFRSLNKSDLFRVALKFQKHKITLT